MRLTTTFKEKISKLPPNRNKIRMFKDKPIGKVIELNKKRQGKTISITTVNHQIGYLTTFFNWSKRNWDVKINPMEGMKLRSKKTSQDEWERFTEEELQKIFHSDASKIRVPTLVIRGSLDTFGSTEDSKELVQDLGSKEKRFVEIPNASHEMIYEKSNVQFFKTVKDFLEED